MHAERNVRRQRTRPLFPVLAVSFGLFLVLLALEIGLRLYGYDPLGRIMDGRRYFLRTTSHPFLEYELVPGARGRHWGCEIRVNSRGFRDREYATPKPPGTLRVVVLGDSITFGNNMPAEETYPEQLEAHYLRTGRAVEVLNLGVGGFDTLHEVAFLERVGLQFQPDVVVVGYAINDLGSHSVNLAFVRVLERYGWMLRNLRVLQFFSQQVEQAQALLETEFRRGESEESFREDNAGSIAPVDGDPELTTRMRRLRAVQGAAQPAPGDPFLAWYLSDARVGKLRFAFERLAALRGRHGFRVLVLLVPFLDDEGRPDVYDAAYDIVRHEAERVAFLVTDPTTAFRTRGLASLGQDHDGARDVLHPNAEGHRILAAWLHAALESMNASTAERRAEPHSPS